MVFRVDHSRRDSNDRTLHLRMLLFVLGAGCAFAGIMYRFDLLITAGIIILAAGLLLRLLNDRRRRHEQEAAWHHQASLEDESDDDTADGPR